MIIILAWFHILRFNKRRDFIVWRFACGCWARYMTDFILDKGHSCNSGRVLLRESVLPPKSISLKLTVYVYSKFSVLEDLLTLWCSTSYSFWCRWSILSVCLRVSFQHFVRLPCLLWDHCLPRFFLKVYETVFAFTSLLSTSFPFFFFFFFFTLVTMV